VTADLPKTEFAFPGPLRDKLVAAVLRGEKTATSWLLAETEEGGEPMPQPGDRWAVVDSDDRPVGVIETLEVRVMRLGDVDLQVALDEGEGFASVAEWREQHEAFWSAYRDDVLDDDTPVVVERFRLVS
jgi:uncharacterized protein YhfF